MISAKKLSLIKLKKILADKGFKIKKKKSNFFLKDLKSFYFTALSGFFLILIINTVIGQY